MGKHECSARPRMTLRNRDHSVSAATRGVEEIVMSAKFKEVAIFQRDCVKKKKKRNK